MVLSERLCIPLPGDWLLGRGSGCAAYPMYCVIVSFVLILVSVIHLIIHNTQLIVIQMKVIFFTILYDI